MEIADRLEIVRRTLIRSSKGLGETGFLQDDCDNHVVGKFKTEYPDIVRHERTFHIKVCVTAQKMRAGPSEPACRSRLQTT
jgi:hypothetical protein